MRDLHGSDKPLTEKQAAVLEKLRYKYRRQLRRINPALVADLQEPKADPSAGDRAKLAAWNEAAQKFNGDEG